MEYLGNIRKKDDIIRRMMEISEDDVERSFHMFTKLSEEEIEEIMILSATGQKHIRDIKMILALAVVKEYFEVIINQKVA